MSCCAPPNHTVNSEDKKIITKNGSLRLGCHLAFNGNLYQAVCNHNCSTCQIYLGASTSYTIAQLDEKDLMKTADYLQQHDKTFYVHCPLVTNVGNPNDASNGVAAKSIRVVAQELKLMESLPCACVMHIGKVGTINDVIRRLNTLDPKLKTNSRVEYPLLLEVAAGQGSELGTSLEELHKIYEGLDKTKIGLCLDTQHAFASGLCDFANHESVVKLFEQVHDICPRGISLVHLNDSECAAGACRDRHAGLGHNMWRKNHESLHTLLALCKDDAIDLISETGSFANDINFINKTFVPS